MNGVHSYLPEEDKNHLSRLYVSANAIKHNILYFRSLLAKETGIMLVVKASAYGNGSLDIAKYVETEKLVNYLAVADVDEGIELRKAGIKLPILILNPSRVAFQDMIDNQLEPEIHHLSLLTDFEAFLKSQPKPIQAYPIHIKLNTGMNRLGFDEEELEALKSLIQQATNWKVESVLTHLSSSGNADDDEFTHHQIKEFKKLKSTLKDVLPKESWSHVLNSDGIYRFPEYHMQMVRLGIGMYGASSLPELKQNLKGICKLCCRVSQIRKVKAGKFVGYNRKGIIEKDSNIATLAIGYADGFSRKLGEGNWEVEIAGKLYPTIGIICMDICMVDLGEDWYESQTQVTIFGGKKSIHDYAQALNTITYEAMTSISARVKRVLID